MNAVMGDVFL